MSLRSRAWTFSLVGAFLVALIIILLRLTVDARAALARGDGRLDAGAPLEAISHYCDAARAAYPGNPYASQALERLWLLGQAQQTGQQASDENEKHVVERHALEAFRAALLATRSFYVPRWADLQVANDRLAGIYARWEGRNARHSPSTFEQRHHWHLEKLNSIPGPKVLWVVTALVGLAIWLAAVAAFIVKALTPDMRLKRGPALGSALAFLCGFGLFLLGLCQ